MVDVSYTLLVDGVAIDSDTLSAIQQIEAEDNAEMADMLRLRAAIGLKDDGSAYKVLDEDIFHRMANVKILVKVGTGPAEPLINSYVIENNVNFSNEPGRSVLNVVAMDPTVLMNLKEKVKSWPNMADSDIATAIFTDRDYNFTPVVETTKVKRQEIDQTIIQRSSDIQFLKRLALRNGYECYVEVNPSTGVTEGHFHPQRLDKTPQGTLSVNLGEATNVNSFNPRYDMLSATTVKTSGIDAATHSDQQAQVDAQAAKKLGKDTPLEAAFQRIVLPSGMGLFQTGELQTYAQALTDRSSLAITADGDLHTAAYGGILRAKRLVKVRGAGPQFSGTYYVEKVLHTLSGDSYTQHFTLRRNALGLTGKEDFTESNALPPQTT